MINCMLVIFGVIYKKINIHRTENINVSPKYFQCRSYILYWLVVPAFALYSLSEVTEYMTGSVIHRSGVRIHNSLHVVRHGSAGSL